MASTLSRNAVIDARSRYVRQASKSANASSNITPKCRNYSAIKGCEAKQAGPVADLGCTGREGWCTPRGDQARLETYMSQNSGLMQGKRGVILGVANNRSIAWGIARGVPCGGARRIAPHLAGRCAEEARRAARQRTQRHPARPLRWSPIPQPSTPFFDVLKEKWGKIDFVVHAICLLRQGPASTAAILETTADNFSRTMFDQLLLADRDRAARGKGF